jgi:hypothetical protein
MRNLVYQITGTSTKGFQATVEVTIPVPDRYNIANMEQSLIKLATAKAEAETGWKLTKVSVDGPVVRH